MLSLVNLASTIIDRGTFSDCSDDYSRVEFLLSCDEFTTLLHRSSSLLEEQKNFLKSAEKSNEYREKGNQAYSQRNDREALSLYNQAVRYAPSYSRELSLAFGNRSAALLNLKHYNLAIDDIHRSLDLVTSTDEEATRRQRLEQRLEQCLRNRSQSNDQDEYGDHLQQLEEELERNQEDFLWNEKYPSLSSYADVQHSAEHGRHIVSSNISKPLKPGSIILVEKPYASILLPSAWSTHCHRCFRRLTLSLFSCSQCTRAIYCSMDCLQESIVWHAFECRLNLEHLDKMQMLAMRLITKSGWSYLLKHQKQFESYLKQKVEQSTQGLTSDIYNPNDYEMVLKLQTNSKRRTVDDLFQRCVQACVLGLSLINNTSFSQVAYENRTYQVYICSLILSHLQSLPCNAHEITEFVYHQLNPLTSTCTEIGAGIYATLSLFNHSCNPNVIRNFIGEKVVVRLLGSISKDGDELNDNYGCLYATMTKKERMEKLRQQYHFKCDCQPCTEEWPLYDQLSDEGTSSTTFNKAFQRLIQGEKPNKDDLIIYEEFIAHLDELSQGKTSPKAKVYNNAQEAYKQCLNFFSHSMYAED